MHEFSIKAEQVGIKFQKTWLFRGVNLTFNPNQKYALLGGNGSGKSTLLQILYGFVDPTEGQVTYFNQAEKINPFIPSEQIAFSAPYLDFFETLTLPELLQFHFKLCPIFPSITVEDIPNILGLEKHIHKPIRQFSSGMKQRVRLSLAMFSGTPAVFLDEPCTNLDQAGIEKYHAWCAEFLNNRLVIVASNQLHEYSFCTNHIQVEDFKSKLSN